MKTLLSLGLVGLLCAGCVSTQLETEILKPNGDRQKVTARRDAFFSNVKAQEFTLHPDGSVSLKGYGNDGGAANLGVALGTAMKAYTGKP